MKERLKKPGEDVADQWADRNSSETAGLIENEQVQEPTTSAVADSNSVTAATEVLEKSEA